MLKKGVKIILVFCSFNGVDAHDFLLNKELWPQFRLVQYGLDKLDFVLHKELSNFLYTRLQKKDLFGIGGFQNLDQGHQDQYVGYKIKDYYQWLGGTYDNQKLAYIGALGVSESSLHINSNHSHAHYDTLWATFGVKGYSGKFQYGFDFLSGYSFIKSSKNVSFLNKDFKAKNNGFSSSLELKATYLVVKDKTSLEPYNALSLFYSKEFAYQEKGNSGYELDVGPENLCLFRNELGFYLNIPCTKSVDLFIDPSWMYEYQLNHRSYKAGFKNVKARWPFYQHKLAHNYGRLNVGFYVKGRRLDFAITYIGLWATKFSSASTSLKLNLKF